MCNLLLKLFNPSGVGLIPGLVTPDGTGVKEIEPSGLGLFIVYTYMNYPEADSSRYQMEF
jgi:hypothetical protein